MRVINKRAKRNYHILETLEAGVVLSGPEVKSFRAGRVDLSDSFARVQNNEVFLKNAYIFPYQQGRKNSSSAYIYPYQGQADTYDPRHDRKLLLHRTEIERLKGKISGSATTLIPLSLYTTRNLIKVDLALAASKKKFDKRRAIKARDEQRKLEQDLRGEKS